MKPSIIKSIFLVLSILIIFISAVSLSTNPRFRFVYDMTRSRAYTLSPQTKNLISRLEGKWNMTFIVGKKDVSSSVLSQIDEVGRRFDSASNLLSVKRFDPNNINDINGLDGFFAQLESYDYEDKIKYISAIQKATNTFSTLEQMSGEISVLGLSLLSNIESKSPLQKLRQGCETLRLLAASKGNFKRELDSKLSLTKFSPIPDYELVADWLENEIRSWAFRIDKLASEMLRRRPGEVSIEVAKFVSKWGRVLENKAVNLLKEAENLNELPSLKLTTIARKVTKGPIVIIEGPDGIAGVSTEQWLGDISQNNEALISFDRRFRGEQVLAEGIRTILDPRNLRVVVLHVESKSPLDPSAKRELVALKEWTRGAGFIWDHWDPRSGSKPKFSDGHKTIWLVISPVARPTLGQENFDDKKLRLATKRLLDEGESVFITLSPSVLPQYGEVDPWQSLLKDLVHVNTGKVLFEKVKTSDGQQLIKRSATLRSTENHPVGLILEGSRIDMPLPIEIKASSQNTSMPIVSADPSENKWFESNWMKKDFDSFELIEELENKATLVRSVERISPIGIGTQRVIVAGSSGWLFSSIAARVLDLGGDKEVLLSPGNMALAEASFTWLGKMDDRLLAGPLIRQASRLQNFNLFERNIIFFLFVLLMPIILLILGIKVSLEHI